MKKIVFLICSILILNISLSAQNNDLITVRAGTRILDYFPVSVRYRYPEFITGKILFKNGNSNTNRLNYNFLLDEMEFIQSQDTLSIAKKKDIRFIAVAQDTFFFDNGYLEQICGGPVSVGLRQRIKLKQVLKKDSYGVSSSGSATSSYNSLPADGNFYKLSANEDMVFQKTKDYYLATKSSGFIQFRKKTVLQLFPEKEAAIKDYLKSNKINFDSKDDLLKLAEFLQRL
ncbi:MAG: hypothetical protein WCS03_14805 [Bacteroidota bacterium]